MRDSEPQWQPANSEPRESRLTTVLDTLPESVRYGLTLVLLSATVAGCTSESRTVEQIDYAERQKQNCAANMERSLPTQEESAALLLDHLQSSRELSEALDLPFRSSTDLAVKEERFKSGDFPGHQRVKRQFDKIDTKLRSEVSEILYQACDNWVDTPPLTFWGYATEAVAEVIAREIDGIDQKIDVLNEYYRGFVPPQVFRAQDSLYEQRLLLARAGNAVVLLRPSIGFSDEPRLRTFIQLLHDHQVPESGSLEDGQAHGGK